MLENKLLHGLTTEIDNKNIGWQFSAVKASCLHVMWDCLVLTKLSPSDNFSLNIVEKFVGN